MSGGAGGAGVGRPGGSPPAGRVVEFDQEVGLGVVESGDGGRFPFHCTQIAGGSRTIDVGASVTFSVVAGRLGRWEAAAVTPAV